MSLTTINPTRGLGAKFARARARRYQPWLGFHSTNISGMPTKRRIAGRVNRRPGLGESLVALEAPPPETASRAAKRRWCALAEAAEATGVPRHPSYERICAEANAVVPKNGRGPGITETDLVNAGLAPGEPGPVQKKLEVPLVIAGVLVAGILLGALGR